MWRPRGWNRVVYAPPGGKARTLTTDFASELAIEDGITLRWDVGGFEFGFYELPRPPTGRCPRRSRFRTVANGDAVITKRRIGWFSCVSLSSFRPKEILS